MPGAGSPLSYNMAPGQSQADADYKRKIAYALMMEGSSGEPIKAWSQGLNRALQGALGGYELYKADKADEAEKADARTKIARLLNPDAPPAPPPMTPGPAAPTPPAPVAGSNYALPDKVWRPDELNPMDAQVAKPQELAAALNMRPGDFDKTVRTVVGEAATQPPVGQQAVANVILNRSKLASADPSQIITPSQFEPWATPQGRQRMAVSPDSPQYRNAAVATYAAGQADPTGGATHFYSPTAQAGLGRRPPAWDNGTGQDIGQHRFFRLPFAGQQPGASPVGTTEPAPPPTQGASPDTPRGGLQDGRRMQLIAEALNNRYTAPFAQALMAKEFEREANRTRPLDEAEKKLYPGAVAIEASGKPVFPPPSTNVQLSTVANPVLEGVGKQIVDQRKAAQNAATNSIPFIHEARKALDEGSLTGVAAQPQVFLQKVGALFGVDASQASNTEVLRSAIGNGVLSHIKELGANPSNADRDYIEKVQGGQINLEESSIRRLLDIQEKYARQSIKRFNADADKLMKASPEGTYKQIAPLMSIEEPGSYVAPVKAAPQASAPQVQEGMTATNPQTGQKIMFKGGQWVPAQ